MTWRLEYDASPAGDGSMMTTWDERKLSELAVLNGNEPLLIWMMRECEARGGAFTLTHVPDAPQVETIEVCACGCNVPAQTIIAGMMAATPGLTEAKARERFVTKWVEVS